MARRTEAIA